MKTRGRWRILRYDILGSTSDEARRLFESGEIEPPFIVHASHQTEGRGRGSNLWWSDEGSLTATLGLDPDDEGIPLDRASFVALAGAYSVLRILEDWTGKVFQIRWPNDVEFEGRKIAGLLCEWIEVREARRLMLGVGINVATRFDTAPLEVRTIATSLCEIDGKAKRCRKLWFLKSAILLRFIDQFDVAIRDLTDPKSLLDRVRGRDVLEGQSIRVQQGTQTLRGVGRGIDDDGALRLETKEGVFAIYAGQILRHQSRDRAEDFNHS